MTALCFSAGFRLIVRDTMAALRGWGSRESLRHQAPTYSSFEQDGHEYQHSARAVTNPDISSWCRSLPAKRRALLNPDLTCMTLQQARHSRERHGQEQRSQAVAAKGSLAPGV